MWPDSVRPVVSREVTDGVHLLEVGWPEPIGANAYLVDDGEVTLVDAGLPVGRRPLTEEIQTAGYHPAAIDRVLVTHYDLDHVGGLRGLDDGVPLYLGARDAALVRGSWSPPLVHPKGVVHRVARRLYPLSNFEVHPVLDGEQVGGFRALLTPGHNPGHTAFVHDDLDVALLGDLVRERDGRFITPPWIDTYDTDRIEASIERVAEESFAYACVGHGSPVGPDADGLIADLAAGL